MKVFLDTNLPCDAHQLSTALAHDDVRDFEDLLQYQCAVAANCDVIVTNTRVTIVSSASCR